MNYSILFRRMSGLIKNPYLTLRPKPIGQELLAVIVEAPVKGRGLQVHKVKRQDDPDFFELLFAIQAVAPEKGASLFFALPESVRTRLWDMGVFLDPETVATPVFYSCFLDEESQHDDEEPLPKDLIISPRFHYRSDEELPELLRHRVQFCNRFLRGYSMAWVEDPAFGMVVPYWISESQRGLISSLKPGGEPPSVSGSLARLLLLAGIFVSRSAFEKSELFRYERLHVAWRDFVLHNYAFVESLLPPLHLKALQNYFHCLIDSGWVRLGDYDTPLRYNAHNDDLVFFFHHQAADLASRIAGRPLKASHNHLISYLPGAVLKKHVDPPEHRYGFSLLLDVKPKPRSHSQQDTLWPLVLNAGGEKKQPVEVPQAVGDGVFYNACDVPHSRQGPLPEGHFSSSLLLHFVSQEDRGPQEYSPFYY